MGSDCSWVGVLWSDEDVVQFGIGGGCAILRIF